MTMPVMITCPGCGHQQRVEPKKREGERERKAMQTESRLSEGLGINSTPDKPGESDRSREVIHSEQP
jgi:hypothetical protein